MSEIPEQKVDDVLDILLGEATGAIAAGKLVEINPFYLDELLTNYRNAKSDLARLTREQVVCNWKQTDADFNTWGGECGAEFDLEAFTPAESGMVYCPKCGKTIEEAKQ